MSRTLTCGKCCQEYDTHAQEPYCPHPAIKRESDLKGAIEDYLQIGQNQGKWIFLRLNAGDFIEVRGNTRRRIKGCQKGTADFLVATRMLYGDGSQRQRMYKGHWAPIAQIIFLELKSSRGKQTKEQREFQEMAERQGASYFIIRSVEELQEILGEVT